MCGRRFAVDKLERHEGVCRKTFGKQRKQFDTKEQRVTEELKSVAPAVAAAAGAGGRPPRGTGTANKTGEGWGFTILQLLQILEL